MKKKFISVLAGAAMLHCSAYAQNPDKPEDRVQNEGWQVSLSAGALYNPIYLGDDDYQVSVFPNLIVQYDDLLTASIQGIEVNAINSNGFKAGPVARFNFGRDEDGGNPLGLGDGTDDLIGLGDVDFTVELGGFAQYSIGNFSAKAELRQGVNGHKGLVGDAELKYGSTFDALGRTGSFSLGPRITFGDKKYNSAFFDVNAAQSIASGLSQYDAGSGMNSYGFHGSVVVPVSDRISVTGFAGYDRLSGDIADSSLVQERGSEDQGMAGIMLSYRF
ncbi:MipA/OmpV family protein [Parasphingorhabdus cellanae]|uniref:MipA/OmpV family protein n=1 Tax=Parasphingorhabdus cellanae TaxID=2806553 RepID=A0ABX7TAC7_9SPHN|nr:MipA/OmpV family protein [Parasphingorhabdus cellanae]QTD57342.1 MipA/OmpV family protein [Parasphingorhabdus cellanae]